MIQVKEFDHYYNNYFDPGFKGKSMVHDWPMVEMKTIKQGKKSDAPLCSPSVPVFSERAIEVLKDLLKGNAELLPLIHKDYVGQDQLYAVNVVNLRDCIDYDKSEREEFGPNMYGRFTKYVFKPDVVKDAHIFKIKDFPYFKELYSDEFREKALRNNLRGFRFTEVWNSEKKQFLT
ncbi:MAG: hypothetical protein MJA31_07820 [Clostridia bacterium]|nr:hypothetical protein [Clostridia bacterium]